MSCRVLMPSYENEKIGKCKQTCERVGGGGLLSSCSGPNNQPEGANGLRISPDCHLAIYEGNLARKAYNACKARKEINEGGGMAREDMKKREKK